MTLKEISKSDIPNFALPNRQQEAKRKQSFDDPPIIDKRSYNSFLNCAFEKTLKDIGVQGANPSKIIGQGAYSKVLELEPDNKISNVAFRQIIKLQGPHGEPINNNPTLTQAERDQIQAEDEIYEKTLKDLGVILSNQKKIIAKGTFGRVLEVDLSDKISNVALPQIKRIAKLQSPHKGPDPKGDSEIAQNELNILTILKNENAPNVPILYQAFSAGNRRFAFIQEHAGQNLYNIYLNPQNPKRNSINWGDLQNIGFQILTGLNHLHTPNKGRKEPIAHYDLTLLNIALDTLGIVRILDFGSSRQLTQNAPSPLGTYIYQPPERFLFQNHSGFSNSVKISTDIWSLGCILFQLFTGKQFVKYRINGENRDLEIFYGIKSRLGLTSVPVEFTFRGDFYTQPPKFSNPSENLKEAKGPPLEKFSDVIRSKGEGFFIEQFIDLLNQMLQWYPKERKTAAELLKHPFFS